MGIRKWTTDGRTYILQETHNLLNSFCWKSPTNLRTNQHLTWVGASDTCVSKTVKLISCLRYSCCSVFYFSVTVISSVVIWSAIWMFQNVCTRKENIYQAKQRCSLNNLMRHSTIRPECESHLWFWHNLIIQLINDHHLFSEGPQTRSWGPP